LLGPNNEGKSNVLRGFAVAMHLLEHLRRPFVDSRAQNTEDGFAVRMQMFGRHPYDWRKDYPVELQSSKPGGASKFLLDFELTPKEIDDFREFVGSNLNGTLPVELTIGGDQATFRVLKQGRGGKTLSRKARSIAVFIGRRLEFHYIPAIRTSENAMSVVNEIVERELRGLEDDPKYVEAIKKIEQLQSPVLARISGSLGDTMKQFLPDINSVDVNLSSDRRYRAFRRSAELIVNDGTATDLAAKGDGVQSLAAISLIRHAVASAAGNRQLILAIEEPESHIHPGAMHSLREVLDEIANQHQVIVTTHNPIFVQRREVDANIIVEKQKARPAKALDEVRRSLGVHIQDNLTNSELALVVEGEEDRVALEALLKFTSPKIRKALETHRLGIDTLGGGSNLSYKLTQLRMALCEVYVFVDNDEAGRKAIEQAINSDLIKISQVTLSTCKNMHNSEMEDLYDKAIYQDYIQKNYGPIMESQFYLQHRDKWSARMAHAFTSLGKPWSNFIEMEMKYNVAQLVAASPGSSLRDNRRNSFDALVVALESLIDDVT
jgi:putative ATP-dependent endonuclease of OLD family